MSDHDATQGPFLDTPFALELTRIAQVQALLRPMAHDDVSILPNRWRASLASMVVQLSRLRQELMTKPEQLTREKGQEDAGHPRRTPGRKRQP